MKFHDYRSLKKPFTKVTETFASKPKVISGVENKTE